VPNGTSGGLEARPPPALGIVRRLLRGEVSQVPHLSGGRRQSGRCRRPIFGDDSRRRYGRPVSPDLGRPIGIRRWGMVGPHLWPRSCRPDALVHEKRAPNRSH
jgi:hypothetical protein